MSDFDVKEKRFEEDIEDYLTHHGGYTKGDPKKFNRESGLEEDTFVEFIKTSQPKKWERYVKIYAENSEKQIIERFKREVKTTNLLNVMRHGFMDRGIKFYPIFWKPETSLNETTQMQYDANILHCTRQLHYSVHNENSIDIVLFANGIPVVSMELKCQFTGQDTTNAINQYKFDRAGKDAIFAFKERVLVHFAVDLTNVYMTTRLEGAHTYFLPFNQGSNGAGKVGGKGNPVNPNGYDTAYLWERVLCKDSLMEILQKYMHLQQEYDKNGNLVKETMIFPRYHQLDVVTKLLEDVKKNGSGKSYLIQHSAGSGKSNSIAWLAHRLGIFCDYGLSIPEYVSLAVKLKEQKSVSRLGNRNDDAEENDKDDSDAGDIGNIRFWNLPIYHDDWRDNLTIELTQEEAFYLDKQIQKSTKGSLLEYVLKNRIDLNEYDDFASLTAELSEKVGEKLAYMMKLACDFNNLVYMARVRYNVMLSEDENTYANDEWSRLLPDIRHNATVDLDAVFGEFQLINPRAKSFLCGIQAAFITLDIDMADELIRKRERSLKGAARAKLSRTKEFDHSKWVGGGMLDYRFSNARRIVNDIYAGEVSADV